MSKIFFRWQYFSVKFLNAVLQSSKTPAKYHPPVEYDEAAFIAPYLGNLCKLPDEHFVSNYREEIEEYFLSEPEHLENVAKTLERQNYAGIRSKDEDALRKLKQCKLSQAVIMAYLDEMIRTGSEGEFQLKTSFYKPRTILLGDSHIQDVKLYSYQQEANIAMQKYFLEQNGRSGILVMPTGSGKTMTSIYFLLHELSSRGYEVIWLAHRHMLVEQAANVFYRLAPLVKDVAGDKIKSLTVTCVSGAHASAHALSKKDDIVVGSVQSLVRNLGYLTAPLKKKVIIVVDEAHHALAPSYKKIINAVRQKCPEAKLLGLTATPIRYTDMGTVSLLKLFEQKIIYAISLSKLIADGTLATPINLKRETNVEIETYIDKDELKKVLAKGDLTKQAVNKIAKINERNEVIIKEYLDNKEKYGKTIIFALNIIHCDVLADMFVKKGVKCDRVYSGMDDSVKDAIIERFRHNNHKDKEGNDDHIDVLINVNILSEGSDIPDIHTVFLTRPTNSDVLLMQMIGRGMRGEQCGGTKEVYIVDFCDKWASFTRWLNPSFLLEGEEGGTPGGTKKEPKKKNKVEEIPVSSIIDAMRAISYGDLGFKVHAAVLPVGWYNVYDKNDMPEKVLVFANQQEGYAAMKADTQALVAAEEQNGKQLLQKYFDGFGVMPTPQELEDIAELTATEKAFPEFQSFDERDDIDPSKLAMKYREETSLANIFKIQQDIHAIYNAHKTIIDSLYGNVESYQRRIFDFLLYPTGVTPMGSSIEEAETEFGLLSAEPFAEPLEILLDEVLAEQKDNLGDDFKRPTIGWTKKAYKTYFAQYVYLGDNIKMNCGLNSVSVPREVLKYLIYHECLHQLIHSHGPKFRELERRFPNFNELDNYLDYQFPTFVKEESR